MEHEKLTIENPALALEWDYEKNGDLHPENFTGGSNKSVWWKCSLGHSWNVEISHRTLGSGCPYCKGNKVWIGFNDLTTTHPQVAKQWDYAKNDELSPEQVSFGSNKSVWWKCSLGHSWKAVIVSRTNGCGCTYCSGRKVLAGFNDLVTTHPEVIAEWDYEKNHDLRPEQFSAGSNKFAWWKCNRGHRWEAPTSVRTKGCICPYCSGKLVIRGETDLKTIKPEVAAEWDYEKNGNLRPEGFTVFSNKYTWWKCGLGHSWRNAINHRSAGQGCPYCKGRKVLIGFNDLATTHPQIAAEWDYTKNVGLSPEQVLSGSNKSVWWKCCLGHNWKADICSRSKGSGCPYCRGRKVMPGFNDLITSQPQIAAEWDYEKNNGLRPEQVSFGSNKLVWWKCKLGHSWKTVIYGRSNERGCPYCTGRKVLTGFNDLTTTNPQIAGEWDYTKNGSLLPEHVTQHSNRNAWWHCKHIHSYRAKISNRYYGKGCPYCAGKRSIIGETDLVTLQPEWLKEWDFNKNSPNKPENYTISSNIKVWWKCKNGHSWRTQIRDRHMGNKCPYCSGKTPMRARLVR